MIFLVSFFFSFCPPVIDKDSVFSIQANLSRLRAELTLQANKRYGGIILKFCLNMRMNMHACMIIIILYVHSLNIPAIRRQLLTQHRSLHPVSTGGYERGCTRLPPLPQWRPRKKTPPKPPTSLEQLKLVSLASGIELDYMYLPPPPQPGSSQCEKSRRSLEMRLKSSSTVAN